MEMGGLSGGGEEWVFIIPFYTSYACTWEHTWLPCYRARAHFYWKQISISHVLSFPHMGLYAGPMRCSSFHQSPFVFSFSNSINIFLSRFFPRKISCHFGIGRWFFSSEFCLFDEFHPLAIYSDSFLLFCLLGIILQKFIPSCKE